MKIKLVTVFVFFASIVFSQTSEDALLMSFNRGFATARVQGTGGAFGALGGDVGAISINPAAVAVFRKGQFSAASGFDVSATKSNFLNQDANGFRFNVPITNFGLILSDNYTTKPKSGNGKGLQFLNFGLTLNRTNHNQEKISLQGFNPTNSFLDRFLIDANNAGSVNALRNRFPFDGALAYEAFLIDPPDSLNPLFSSVIPNGGVEQTHNIIRRGSSHEIGASLGANISNKLFLGGSFNLVSVRFRQETVHTEVDVNNQIFDFAEFTYKQNLSLQGTGLNLKLGAIFQPLKWLRIGASVQSPSWLTVDDEFDTEIQSRFDNGDRFTVPSEIIAIQNYNLNTPGRYTLSAAFLFQQKGFLSIDYEALNYGSIKYKFPDNPSNAIFLNDDIQQKFTNAQSLRIGGEYRIGAYSLRSGVAMWSSPFSERFKVDNFNLQQTDFNAGFGIRKTNIAFDFSYTYSRKPDFYTPYNLESGSFSANISAIRHLLLATMHITLH